MRTDKSWSAVLRPILWFSSGERLRRRDLKTLATLETRGNAARSDMATIDARAAAGASQLADQRRTFDQAQQAVQDSQAELQQLIAQVTAIGAGPKAEVKAPSVS